ncbi:hypothetical protein [[Clostridium] symbiosum]
MSFYVIESILEKSGESTEPDFFATAVDKAGEGVVYFWVDHLFSAIRGKPVNAFYNLFDYLSSDWNIYRMSAGAHYDTWCQIVDTAAQKDITGNEGLQRYLEYCRVQGITKEYLETENGREVSDAMLYKTRPDKEKKLKGRNGR